ncbi:MAG: hypothetical protein ACYTEZ_10590 [Planctomycetota bacterium]|jgi:tetratricopeptide (TPR) repeat protein
MRILALLGLLLAVAAAEERLTLTLADGKQKSVTLKSFDDDGLTVTQGPRELRFAWAELRAESAYAARKALTPYDDGAARLALAEFAAARKLHPQALEQLEIALALGGIDEAAFETRFEEIVTEEVAHLSRNIDTLLKAQADPALSLAAIKKLKDRYPEHEANRQYEPHIRALVEQLAAKAEAKQDAQQKVVHDAALERLQQRLDKEVRRKVAALAKAAQLREEAKPAIALRQVSRVKKRLVEPRGAERYLKQALKHLRNMARIDPQARIVAKKQLQQEYGEIEKKLIDCYLQVARILLRERNYKGALKYVRKILLYDPIHEEALEMAEEIRKNRINFKLSDLTNARPRVTGG